MAENTILQIESLSKSFSIKKRIKEGTVSEHRFLLNDFSLAIEAGKITALIGGNGTGKTSLFNIISGLLGADKGKILFTNGSTTNISGLPPYKISRLGIGRMFQDNHIFPEMTVIENMLIADDSLFGENIWAPIFQYKKNKQTEKDRKEEALMVFEKLFGSSHFFKEKINHKAKSLSYGQQRLLGLARLMMAGNKLLLLDEPTSGVNPQHIASVADAIRKMVADNNLTVFLIEHNMKFVADLADTCAFINNGRIEMHDTPVKVLGNDNVRKSYLGA